MISGRALTLGLSLLAVVGAAGVPAYNHFREQRSNQLVTEATACRAQLREIYAALQAYAMRNNGAYPDALEALTEQQLLTPLSGRTASEMLSCPVGQTYQYSAKGLTVVSKGNRPLVTEAVPAHGRAGRHVLYEDGAIEMIGW